MLKKYILHICVRFDVFVLSICYKNPVLGTLFFTGVLVFLVWAQNTFIVSFDRETRAFFATTTIMVAVPIGIKIMRWAPAILRDSKERHNLIHSSFLCFSVLFCLVLLDYAGVITFVDRAFCMDGQPSPSPEETAILDGVLRSEGHEIERLKKDIFVKLGDLIKTDGVLQGVRSNTAEVKLLHVIDLLPDEGAPDLLSSTFAEIKDSLMREGAQSRFFQRAVETLVELQAEKVSSKELSAGAPLR